jgi:hypothetical protein
MTTFYFEPDYVLLRLRARPHEHFYQWTLDPVTLTLILKCSCGAALTMKQAQDWINSKG